MEVLSIDFLNKDDTISTNQNIMKKIIYTTIILSIFYSCNSGPFDSQEKLTGAKEPVRELSPQQRKDSALLAAKFPTKLDEAISLVVELVKEKGDTVKSLTSTKQNIVVTAYNYDLWGGAEVGTWIIPKDQKVLYLFISDLNHDRFFSTDLYGNGFSKDENDGDELFRSMNFSGEKFLNYNKYDKPGFMKLGKKYKIEADSLYLLKLKEIYIQMKLE